ncbi:unnamed protein product [Mesocestoides corti]|uniref:Uncharacterized protein n=1 Tax=Mesocestoides corti TaxID=53468 RepID=A0A0R3UGI5_MESCO|nr:unnamed protein product [Mesocestoides corti]
MDQSKTDKSVTPRPQVVCIDVVPSAFLISPQVDQRLRVYAKMLAEKIAEAGSMPSVNFYVHEKTPNLECGDDTTPFVRSWQSILKMKYFYEGLRSRLAAISKLPMGLCLAEDQHALEVQHHRHEGRLTPINLRLGVPTLDVDANSLLATPPSLAWALTVTMEFNRLQAEDEKTRRLDSNLTVKTVGVLENWIEFLTYGTLLTDDINKSSVVGGDKLLSNTTSMVQRVSCEPPIITIVIDPVTKGDLERGCVEVDTEGVDEQFLHIEFAWRNAVTNQVSDGSAILICDDDLKTSTEATAHKVITLCQERLSITAAPSSGST